MAVKNWRAAILWLVGGLCILFGSMIAGNLDRTLGVTDLGYLFAFLTSLMLILFGGLMWISIAIAVKK